FAMSTLGAGARSLRAPAMPSIVGRRSTGSKRPGCETGVATIFGGDQDCPPFVETAMNSDACPWSVPTPKTYAFPVLSVRTVQPSIGLRWLLLAAPLIWCCDHVSPPSCDT